MDPAVYDRIKEGTRLSLAGSVKLGCGTRAKEGSRALQLSCCNPDPNFLSRSRSKKTAMSGHRIPGSQDPRR